jgi:hypothetical protein
MKNYSILAWPVLLLAAIAIAQPSPDTLWTRSYGGLNVDQAYSIQNTADGGFVIAGLTRPMGSDFDDFYVVKINSEGDTLWTRTYGGAGDDQAYSIQQTPDGGFMIAGVTNSYGAGGRDAYVVKTDALGDSLWTRTYGGSGDDGARSLQQTTDGGCVIAGFTDSFDAGGHDFYLVKINALGDTLWTRTYGGEIDQAYSVQQTTDGGYVLAGLTVGWQIFSVVKTDSLGDTLWTRVYHHDGVDEAPSIRQTLDGGYVIAGYTHNPGEGRMYLLKTDSEGDTVWTRRLMAPNLPSYAYCVQQTPDSGFLIAGCRTGDALVVKTSPSGFLSWYHRYGGDGLECANSIQLTSDGGFVLAGWTFSYGAGLYDFYVVRTGTPATADDDVDRTPTAYSLSCYPNPFNSTNTIAFSLPQAGVLSVRVFDVLGREVSVLKDGFVEAGTHRVTFDGSSLASGIYFVRIDAGEFVQTNKLMLLK